MFVFLLKKPKKYALLCTAVLIYPSVCVPRIEILYITWTVAGQEEFLPQQQLFLHRMISKADGEILLGATL